MLMLMNYNIKLTISGRDTLKPRGISFRPFLISVCDIKYHIRCSGFDQLGWLVKTCPNRL